MEGIMEFAAKHHLFVVEDCAQSHGAVFNGRPVGTYGDLGCYSFYPTKNLGGFGDGGMVVTKSRALAERIRSLRMYGMRGVYSSTERGLCSRLDEIQAAILRVKLRYLSAENKRRRRNASQYRRLIEGVSGLRFQAETLGGKHVYHQFVVAVDNRDKVRDRLSKQGIGTGVHYPVALCDQPAFKKYSSAHDSYPISRRLAKTVMSLPIHPYLKHDAIDYVSTRLVRALVETK
jgi:dTDP-4-amino-4,6-dideoxygalactose transaminase